MEKQELVSKISELKKEKNAIILAHYYQQGDIQDIADVIGDSLQLAQAAQKTTCDMIVFAGVHFMAETAKILNPTKKVVLPDLEAGCSLAESCPTEDFRRFKEQHPDHVVISYINCTAEIKALSDILVTSSNAEKIVNSVPKNTPIIFAPDEHLGSYLVKKTGRDMLLWNGSCIVHTAFDLEKIVRLKARHENSQIIAHPECPKNILEYADFIGSTSAMLNYSKSSDCNTFIVVTEAGILHQMEKSSPTKMFIPAPTTDGCACNDCPYMKLNTLEKLYTCMLNEAPEITLSEELIKKSLVPLQRMLDLSV